MPVVLRIGDTCGGGVSQHWPATMAAALRARIPVIALAVCVPSRGPGNAFERRLYLVAEPPLPTPPPPPATAAARVARAFGVGALATFPPPRRPCGQGPESPGRDGRGRDGRAGAAWTLDATAALRAALGEEASAGPATPTELAAVVPLGPQAASRAGGRLARLRTVYLAGGNLSGMIDAISDGTLAIGESPFPVDWCLRVWPHGPEPACALVAALPTAGESLDLRTRALTGSWAAFGLTLSMPRDQDLLAAVLVPGTGVPPGLHPYLHPIGAESGPLRPVNPDATYLLRIRQGPNQGRQIVLTSSGSRPYLIGPGAADLDLGGPETTAPPATVRAAVGGGALAVSSASSPLHTSGLRVAPGSGFTAGGSEVILLRCPQPPASPPGAQAWVSPRGRGALDLEVQVEGDERVWGVRIAAQGDPACGEVARRLASYLGVAGGRAGGLATCLYRARDGLHLPASLPWRETGLLRGDLLVLGPVAPGSPAEAACRPAGGPDGPSSAMGEGVRVSRGPRSCLPPAPHHVDPPPVPGDTAQGGGLLWQGAASLGLAVTAAITAVAIPALRWLALAGAVASLSGALAAVMGDRSRRRAQARRFRARLARLDRDLAGAAAIQARALAAYHPPAIEVARWASSHAGRLWERRREDRDFLVLRLGTGRRDLLLEAPPAPKADDGDAAQALAAVMEAHRFLDQAPVTVPRLPGGGAGIVGDAAMVDGLARALVIQAATMHAPADLTIAVVAGSRSWAWSQWLPHAQDGGAILVSSDGCGADALATSLARSLGDTAPQGGALLVLIDRDVRERPAVLALVGAIQAGNARHAEAVILAGGRQHLPSGAVAIVQAGPGGSFLLGAGADGGAIAFRPETLGAETAARAARALAPCYEAGRLPSGPRAAPRNGSLLELTGAGQPDCLCLEALWDGRRRGEPLLTPIGLSDAGEVVTLGLRRDGPHGLVAGTTGSGKSELLQSILTGLALVHPPAELCLMLVDYKGGASFAELSRLPHTVGLVTDLDGRLAARALLSLNAELRRRERVLRDAGVASIAGFERQPGNQTAPLPNLLIVVDELAALTAELPDFVDALVDIAQRGRSLGVHLLLATQSPAGVVTPKIQANINYSICMRVAGDGESSAVIGTPQAAQIPVNAPGRAYLKVGGRVTGFQAARIALPVERNAGPSVTVVPFPGSAPAPMNPRGLAPGSGTGAGCPDPGETELRAATRRIAAEARRLGIEQPASPWLPPLPAVLGPLTPPVRPRASDNRLALLVGLADEPELQRQTPALVDLSDDGSCVVLGAFGAGKTSLLRQMALDAACSYSAGEVHLYGLDAGDGSLAGLTALPHCADVAGAGDPERMGRLLRRLCRIAEQRRSLLLASAAGDWARHRQAAVNPGAWILLLVDDYPAIIDPADLQPGSVSEQLTMLIRRGSSVGIHVVVAAQQRSDLSTATFGAFGRRILLRQSDQADYDLVGLPAKAQPATLPPGRAFLSGAVARELQVIWAGSPAGANGAFPPPAMLGALAASAHLVDPGQCPRPVPAFPAEVGLPTLAPQTRAGRVVVGVGGPELEPIGIDFERDGFHLLVAGGDRTGRSAALMTLSESASNADPAARIVILAPRPSPLRELVRARMVETVATTGPQIEAALAALAAGQAPGRSILVADDGEALPPGAALALNDLLRSSRETGLHAMVAGRGVDLVRMYEDWIRYLRSLRCGILLAPEETDGELFDLRLTAPLPARLPGRGYLVRGRQLEVIQVALPSTLLTRRAPVRCLQARADRLLQGVPAQGERTA